ncbi:hypothetical protein FRC20_003585 [Serendipita sp. 405]|nr:hypothetical protein FRC20_003585 [Serendipita sp. 405]
MSVGKYGRIPLSLDYSTHELESIVTPYDVKAASSLQPHIWIQPPRTGSNDSGERLNHRLRLRPQKATSSFTLAGKLPHPQHVNTTLFHPLYAIVVRVTEEILILCGD